jgi:hypothetical protein
MMRVRESSGCLAVAFTGGFSDWTHGGMTGVGLKSAQVGFQRTVPKKEQRSHQKSDETTVTHFTLRRVKYIVSANGMSPYDAITDAVVHLLCSVVTPTLTRLYFPGLSESLKQGTYSPSGDISQSVNTHLARYVYV